MKILGVSGSPVQNGNTDRALKKVLEATELETEFVSLKDYVVAPCRACLGCVESQSCVVGDDGIVLAEKVKQADALVIAGFTPYSSLDARTKAFMERLYPLRHKKGLLDGKPGGAVITCAVSRGHVDLPPAFETGSAAVRFFMMEEGMTFLGSVRVGGNVPCVKCGYGNSCTMSGISMLFGRDATVESVGIHAFEDQVEAVEAAVELGKSIGDLVRAKHHMEGRGAAS